MADYDQREEQNPYITKRVRYFDNQLLIDQDFIDDQKYHIDRLRRHQRLLTAPGIAEGLVVTSTGGMGLKVSAGTAMDDLGRSILLDADKSVTINGTGTLMLYILFNEVESDQSGSGQIKGYTRFTQAPVVAAAASVPAHGVKLATVTVVNSNQLNLTSDGRLYAGLRMPSVGDAPVLRSASIDANSAKAGLTGDLNVTGAVGIGMPVSATPAARLEVTGTTTDGSASALKISNSSTGLWEIKNSGATTLSGSLDLAHGTRTGTHVSAPTGLYVTGNFQDSVGAEFRQSSGAQGLGLGANTLYAAGSNTNQDVRLLSKGSTSSVKVVNDAGSSLLEVRKDGKIGVGRGPDNSIAVDITGDVRTSGTLYAAAASGGKALSVGDDLALHDINQANVVGLYGVQDSTQGNIQLGSGGPLLTGKSARLGINASTPVAALDVAQTTRTGTHPTSIKGLYVTGSFSDTSGVEFRTDDANYGLGFASNTIYAAGNANQDIRFISKGATSSVKVINDSGASILEARKDGKVGVGKAPDSSITLDVSGDLRASGAITASGSGGKSFIIGDDVALCDINQFNTVSINGMQDATQANVRLGTGGATLTGKTGYFGINNVSPIAALDIVQGTRSGGHPTSIKALYITGDFGEADGVEIRHNNASQGIGIGYNTVYAAGGQTNQDLCLKPKNSGKIWVKGALTVDSTINAGNITGAVITSNTLTFPSPTGDPAPVITARTIPAGQGAASERTELILFHGNDATLGAGPDTITLRAPYIRLQTFNDASVQDINNNAGAVERFCIDSSGNISLGIATARSGFDTYKSVMTGAANDYTTAQFLLSGGGTVTWTGANNRLKWTYRFIAISMEKGTSFSAGYIDINQPTSIIPAEYVWNGVARYAGSDGVQLNAWEALWAVHTVGGSPSDITFRITSYSGGNFVVPSNWILVAVVNADDNTVRLGTGVTIANQSSSTKSSPIPSGVIVMWSGATNALPDGWALCDGNGGRPNLLDRFIVGAGSSYGVGATGGRNSMQLTVDQLPPHSHAYVDTYFSENQGSNQGWFGSADSDWDNAPQSINRTTSNTGSNTAIDIRPLYYALAFIIKL